MLKCALWYCLLTEGGGDGNCGAGIRNSHLECSVKKCVLRNFPKKEIFYWKGESDTGVFLWVLQNF